MGNDEMKQDVLPVVEDIKDITDDTEKQLTDNKEEQ